LGWSGSLVAEEQPVVDVVEMPEMVDIQEGVPDLWTADVTTQEAYELVPETDLTREPEGPALDVGTDVGPGAPKSSGCSTGPNGTGATSGTPALLALLVLVAWSSRRHNIFRFPL
jgi:MYXO-CTERM domain-containing protein